MAERQKIVVQADPDLSELIPGFLENRRKDVMAIKDAVERGDFDKIRILGHSMKGSGGGYGFDAITGYGAQLEQSAKEQDKESVMAVTGQLGDYLRRVEVVYE
jgi:HPt (histidine-containing phosphotransfer) domain-containing protein